MPRATFCSLRQSESDVYFIKTSASGVLIVNDIDCHDLNLLPSALSILQ